MLRNILLIVAGLIHVSNAYHVICVYTNWAQYRPDGGKFMPEDVDPTLCTHLIYVYAKLKGNKLVPAEWNDEGTVWREGMYDRVNQLKQLNPELKTLLGVGGWMMGSKDFSKLAAGRMARKLFAKTTTKFLRDRNFDGLAIDWQHPTKRGGKPKDKENYSLLLKEVREAFDEDSKKTGQPGLLLATGVSASREIIDDAYEINNLTRYVDLINVMAYDLHGDWDNYTGHPSQLYAREEEFGPSTEVNVDGAMRYWMSKVPDRSKLILGVSAYGRTFTLRKARHNDYNVPTTGPGTAGEFTQQPGMLAYYERCSQFADATRVWDESSQVAYWYSGDQWAALEDTESIKSKVNWTRTYDSGGMMVWSLDTDDFKAKCGGETYPLLRAVVNALNDPTFERVSVRVMTGVKHTTTEAAGTLTTKSIESTKNEFLSTVIETTVVTEKPTAVRNVKKLRRKKVLRKNAQTVLKTTVKPTTKSVTEKPKEEKKIPSTDQTVDKKSEVVQQSGPVGVKRKRPLKRKIKRKKLSPEKRHFILKRLKAKRRKVAGRKQVHPAKTAPTTNSEEATFKGQGSEAKHVTTSTNDKKTDKKQEPKSTTSKGSSIQDTNVVKNARRLKVARRKRPVKMMSASRKDKQTDANAQEESSKIQESTTSKPTLTISTKTTNVTQKVVKSLGSSTTSKPIPDNSANVKRARKTKRGKRKLRKNQR